MAGSTIVECESLFIIALSSFVCSNEPQPKWTRQKKRNKAYHHNFHQIIRYSSLI